MNPLQQRGRLLDSRQLRSMGVGAPAPPTSPAPMLHPGDRALAPDELGSVANRGCDPTRVALAGGALNQLILHPSVIPFEQLYRRLPDQGMFSTTVSPTQPFVFEMGAFRVPNNISLLLFDLRPDIYRFSGIDAGDYVPVQARRFSSIIGFDINIDQRRPANIQFQIDPAAIDFQGQQAFAPNPGVSDLTTTLDIGASSSFVNVAGTGNALNPQRPERYGAQSVPFTMIAKGPSTVQVRCILFRPMPSPIAFIEYDIAGLMMPSLWLEQSLKQVSPCTEGGA